MDMATVFHHTWTYQALAHDVLELSLNRLVVDESAGKSAAGGARSKTRACELDGSDKFWTGHKGSPFPRVAEAIQEELEQYRTFEQEVKKLKSSMVSVGLCERCGALAWFAGLRGWIGPLWFEFL